MFSDMDLVTWESLMCKELKMTTKLEVRLKRMSEMLGKWLFSCWFGIWKMLGVQQESKRKNEFDW